MPQPDSQQYRSDTLSQISVAYGQQMASNFAFSQVFPIVEVERSSDYYYIFDKNAWRRDQFQARGPAQESAGSGFTLSNTSYLAKVKALHKDWDHQTRADWNVPGSDPGRSATNWLTELAMIAREVEWASTYFVTGVWGTSTTPGTLWDVDVGSDPIGNVRTGKRTIKLNTGRTPNRLVVGYDVHSALVDNPQIVARISGGASPVNPALVTPQIMAQIFEVERYIVMEASYSTNVEGETAAEAFIGGKHALLTYAPASPAIETPSAGYTFAWTGGEMQGLAMSVAEIPMPLKKATRYEMELAWDEKITGTDLGYFFESVVS